MLNNHSFSLSLTILLIFCTFASATTYLGYQVFSDSTCSSLNLLTTTYSTEATCTQTACSPYSVQGYYHSIVCVSNLPTVYSVPALLTSYYALSNCSQAVLMKTYTLNKCLLLAIDKFQKINNDTVINYSDSSCQVETSRFSIPSDTLDKCLNPRDPGGSYVYSQFYYPSTPAVSNVPITQNSTIKNGAKGNISFSYILASILLVLFISSF